jgi:hypothetical protein
VVETKGQGTTGRRVAWLSALVSDGCVYDGDIDNNDDDVLLMYIFHADYRYAKD